MMQDIIPQTFEGISNCIYRTRCGHAFICNKIQESSVPPVGGYDVRFKNFSITTVKKQQRYNDRIIDYADRLT